VVKLHLDLRAAAPEQERNLAASSPGPNALNSHHALRQHNASTFRQTLERLAARAKRSTVRLTPRCLSCAAKARVPKPTRRDACIVASPAAAQESVGRRAALRACSHEGLQPRTEAGPRQLQAHVGWRVVRWLPR
jgi:hypothetical protein